MIVTKLETITPQLAEKYLKFNLTNRSVRWSHVDALKQDILCGRWLVTHQGIAFDAQGNLLDGQHRLLAIEASGKDAKLFVTRGLEAHVNGDLGLFTMDVIDTGRVRTAPDQLHLLHGVTNANLTVGAIRHIVSIFAPSHGRRRLTTSQCIPILSVIGKDVEAMIVLAEKSRLCRRSALIAICALGNQIDAQVAAEFMSSMNTGSDIKRGDPVYALREHIIHHGYGSGRTAIETTAELIANAFYHTIKGNVVNQLKPGVHGMDFLRSKQRGNSEKIRAILYGK